MCILTHRHFTRQMLKPFVPCRLRVNILFSAAWRCASAVYAMAFVCPSVCHKSVFYRNGCMDASNGFFLAESVPSAYHTVHCKEIRVSSKITVLPSRHNVPKLKLSRLSCFLPRQVDRYKFCQLCSTDDRRQFITVSVQHCLQHNSVARFVSDSCDLSI